MTYYWCSVPDYVQCNIPVRVVIKTIYVCSKVVTLPLLVSKGPMTLLYIDHPLNVYNGGMSRHLEMIDDKLPLHFKVLI